MAKPVTTAETRLQVTRFKGTQEGPCRPQRQVEEAEAGGVQDSLQAEWIFWGAGRGTGDKRRVQNDHRKCGRNG